MSDFLDVARRHARTSRAPTLHPHRRRVQRDDEGLAAGLPRLTEEERWRWTFALIPPTLCSASCPTRSSTSSSGPKTPNTIDIEIGYCFDPKQLEVPMFDQLFADAHAGVDNFNVQDVYADTMVQRGLRSRFAPRGRYSWQEGTLPQFNRWLVQRYRALAKA